MSRRLVKYLMKKGTQSATEIGCGDIDGLRGGQDQERGTLGQISEHGPFADSEGYRRFGCIRERLKAQLSASCPSSIDVMQGARIAPLGGTERPSVTVSLVLLPSCAQARTMMSAAVPLPFDSRTDSGVASRNE